ncbi:cation-transporting P-type ATPase [Mycoplasmopsis cynos]|nr:cation-transporting P-type ATPase [Mycoplasmopsis cynos]
MINKLNNEYVKNRIGLSSEKAKEFLLQYGQNKIKVDKKLNVLKVFLGQFKDFMIILLLITAAFSVGVAIYETYFSGHNNSTKDIVIGFVEPYDYFVCGIFKFLSRYISRNKKWSSC